MDFSLTLIPIIVYTICVFAVVTLYLNYKTNSRESFAKVLTFVLCYIFIDSINSLAVELFWPNEKWRAHLSPFILLYGPLLYFGILALKKDQVPARLILIHSSPFIGYLLYFLALSVGVVDVNDRIEEDIVKQLYLLGSVSFIVYTLVSFVEGRKMFASYRNYLLLFVFARVVLLFLGIMFLVMLSIGSIDAYPGTVLLLKVMGYICILIFLALTFNFTINKLLNRFSIKENVTTVQAQDQTSVKYEKSSLSTSQLEAINEQLALLMEAEKVFLDSELSLTSLAHFLKVPNHHLTQVFSTQLNQTFYQYVNGFRIDHACKLLNEDLKMSIEEVAEKSGFSSKASFNRQFKNIKLTTPSEYRQISLKF